MRAFELLPIAHLGEMPIKLNDVRWKAAAGPILTVHARPKDLAREATEAVDDAISALALADRALSTILVSKNGVVPQGAAKEAARMQGQVDRVRAELVRHCWHQLPKLETDLREAEEAGRDEPNRYVISP